MKWECLNQLIQSIFGLVHECLCEMGVREKRGESGLQVCMHPSSRCLLSGSTSRPRFLAIAAPPASARSAAEPAAIGYCQAQTPHHQPINAASTECHRYLSSNDVRKSIH